MNWLDFFSSVVHSLVWPVTVVAIVVLLRKPLASLIRALAKVKLKDLEFEFNERLDRVELAAESSLPKEVMDMASADSGIIARNWKSSFPVGAFVRSWIGLEKAAVALVRKRNPDARPSDLKNTTRLINALVETGALTEDQIGLFVELRNLRNSAVHAENLPLSDIDAIKYVAAAEGLRKLLESKG